MIAGRELPSKTDREALRFDFCQFMAPDEMLRRYDVLRRTLPAHTFLTKAGYQFALDAYVASTAARRTAASMVRLVPDDPPDCELVINDEIRPFEIVSADAPDRKMGAEYRAWEKLLAQGEPVIQNYPYEQGLAEARSAGSLIRAASEKKAARDDYVSSWSLLVYLLTGGFGWGADIVENGLLENTTLARRRFREVWIMWNGTIYRMNAGGFVS